VSAVGQTIALQLASYAVVTGLAAKPALTRIYTHTHRRTSPTHLLTLRRTDRRTYRQIDRQKDIQTYMPKPKTIPIRPTVSTELRLVTDTDGHTLRHRAIAVVPLPALQQ